MDTKKENISNVMQDNIFRRHFFQFGLVGMGGIIAFALFYAIGWYDIATLSVLVTPSDIPSYLIRCRAEKNKAEKNAITHIGILGFVLWIVATFVLLYYPIEAFLNGADGKMQTSSFVWFTLKVLIIQITLILSGIFPRPPRD